MGSVERPEGAFQGVVDGGYNQVNRFGMVVDGFSRFSRLLDANFDALHGSFSSVIRLLDVFGEFFYVVRTFAVFNFLFGGIRKGWRVMNFLLGRNISSTRLLSGKDGIEIDDYKKFQVNQNRKGFPMMLVMFGVIVASLPLLFVKLWRSVDRVKLRQILDESDKLEDAWRNEPKFARAKFGFGGETEMDLPFREGDVIRILGKPFPDWWEGELNGRKGIFPSNFVEVTEEPK